MSKIPVSAEQLETSCKGETALQLRSRSARKYIQKNELSFNTDVNTLDHSLRRAAAFAPNHNTSHLDASQCPFLEIHGPAASGKSVLLEAMIARRVLPKWWHRADAVDGIIQQRIRIGGRRKRVILIDLSPRGFDFRRLERQMTQMIYDAATKSASSYAADDDGAEETSVGYREETTVLGADFGTILRESLKLVHVVRAEDPEEILVRLYTLRGSLVSLPRPTIDMIAVEDAGAFHWEDRVNAGLVGTGSPLEKLSESTMASIVEPTPTTTTTRRHSARDEESSSVRKECTAGVVSRNARSIAEDLGTTLIVATVGAIWDPTLSPFSAKKSQAQHLLPDAKASDFMYKDHMPVDEWQNHVTHRIVTGISGGRLERKYTKMPGDERELTQADRHPKRVGSGTCRFAVVTYERSDVDTLKQDPVSDDESSRPENTLATATKFQNPFEDVFEFDVDVYGLKFQ